MESDNNNSNNHQPSSNQHTNETNATPTPPIPMNQQNPQPPPPLPPPPPPAPPHLQQQTIVHVRDRLFHALFYRLALMYARKFPKFLRRLIEFFVLMLAISSFGLLSYLHVVFNRNPINCLAPIQDKWPRDGILRVEIVHNASSFYIMSYDTPNVTSNQKDHNDFTVNYSLRESYEKEYSNSMLDLFSSYINTEEVKNSVSDSTSEPIQSHSNEQAISSTDIDAQQTVALNDSFGDVLLNNQSNSISDSEIESDLNFLLTDQIIENIDEELNFTLNGTNAVNPELNETLNYTDSSSPVAYVQKFSVENHKKEIPTSTIEKMSPAYRLIKEAFSELQLISRVCKFFLDQILFKNMMIE